MATSYLYTDFGDFLRDRFPFKVQKISLNAGFTCPNRDGTKGWGGCTYCNNQTFNPAYCHSGKSITRQLEEGKAFLARKYPEMKYLAYFQAYTNTYGEVEELVGMYEEALAVRDVVGLVIGTRPDCMPSGLLDALQALARRTFLMVEYGIESTDDATLSHIRRGLPHGRSRDLGGRAHHIGIAGRGARRTAPSGPCPVRVASRHVEDPSASVGPRHGHGPRVGLISRAVPLVRVGGIC